MALEYVIYCDESESKGRHYSNFYGGALVTSRHLDRINRDLAQKKRELHLFGEVKWSKVTVNYCRKYIDLVDFFFDMVMFGQVKLRIMFTQNIYQARNLTKEHVDQQYFILYYLFIRHAFGLIHSPRVPEGIKIRIYLDRVPNTREQVAVFKSYLANLTKRSEFKRLGLRIDLQDIAEVTSHDHDILQCLDIVLGAMNFRLNDKHLDKPVGAERRSPKTLAKLKLYKHINKRIRGLYPHFNIGSTTGGTQAHRWSHPYRHWCFRSKEAQRVGQGKRKRKKVEGPIAAT